jgi:hypothetical protein
MSHLDILMYHVEMYTYALQINLGNRDSYDVSIELEGNGTLDIHEYAYACYFIFVGR